MPTVSATTLLLVSLEPHKESKWPRLPRTSGAKVVGITKQVCEGWERTEIKVDLLMAGK